MQQVDVGLVPGHHVHVQRVLDASQECHGRVHSVLSVCLGQELGNEPGADLASSLRSRLMMRQAVEALMPTKVPTSAQVILLSCANNWRTSSTRSGSLSLRVSCCLKLLPSWLAILKPLLAHTLYTRLLGYTLLLSKHLQTCWMMSAFSSSSKLLKIIPSCFAWVVSYLRHCRKILFNGHKT